MNEAEAESLRQRKRAVTRPATPSRETPSLTVQTFWLMVAKTAGFALSIGLPVLLVRLFNKQDFGLYRQAFTVINTSFTVLNMGVGLSAFYYLARKSQDRSRIPLNILIFNLAVGGLAGLSFILHPQLLQRIFGTAELVGAGPLIGMAIFLTILSSPLEVIATALQDVKHSTIFIVLAQLSKALFLTVAALLRPSVKALLWAAIAQGILQSAILLWYLHKQFGSFWLSFDRHFFAEQIGYAVPYGWGGMLFFLQTDLHNYFVANAFGPAAFAIYSVGCVQIPLIGLLRDSITAVLLSRISALQHQGEPREILLLIARAMRKLALVYLPVYVLFMVLGRESIMIFYTRAYEASWPIFAVNLSMLLLLVPITDPVLRAYAEYRYFIVRVRVVLLVVQIAALWYGTRSMGMIGAVGIVVSMTLAERIIVVWKTAAILGMNRRDLRLFAEIPKIGLLAAACGAPTYLLRQTLLSQPPLAILVICGAVFGTLLAGGFWKFGILEDDERQIVQRHARQAMLRFMPAAPRP